MSKTFDPAPPDRHAEDQKQSVQRDTKRHSQLDKELKESFPASEPPASTQPAKATGKRD